VLLTDLLASQSLSSGVKRFIYMSTIKVNGGETKPGEKYKSNDIPDPKDVYAISKYHAELKLQEICKNSSLEYVIIRPPLVYGGGVKANFLRLVKLVKLGIPLPFGSINNKRSFICLENLIDFIVLCLDNPKAKNKVFLVSDGDDISTCDLLVLIAQALNVNLRLFNIKQNTLEITSSILGFRKQMSRLTSSLQVDIEPSKDLLGWLPKYRMKDQLGWLINQSEQDEQKNI
jgi:nucleoside-diphosphate-sugar epimerase